MWDVWNFVVVDDDGGRDDDEMPAHCDVFMSRKADCLASGFLSMDDVLYVLGASCLGRSRIRDACSDEDAGNKPAPLYTCDA